MTTVCWSNDSFGCMQIPIECQILIILMQTTAFTCSFRLQISYRQVPLFISWGIHFWQFIFKLLKQFLKMMSNLSHFEKFSAVLLIVSFKFFLKILCGWFLPKKTKHGVDQSSIGVFVIIQFPESFRTFIKCHAEHLAQICSQIYMALFNLSPRLCTRLSFMVAYECYKGMAYS